MRRWIASVCAALVVAPAAHADGTTISGGLDLRATRGSDATVALNGVFLNVHQVFEQDGADRWIVVAQADSGDNGQSPHLYQTYVQLKGPLGHWNVRAGRLILPFGLLASYDSERQVLQTIEPLTLGAKLGQGVQVDGFSSRLDYAVAAVAGMQGHDAVLIARVGTIWGEVHVGASLLNGSLPEVVSAENIELPNHVLPGIPFVNKHRLGLDATWDDGPTAWRGELVAGTDNGVFVKGAYGEVERALDANWTLGFNAGVWDGAAQRWRYGAALTRTLGAGRLLRLAYVDQAEPEGLDHALVAQFEWEFARAL